MCVAAEYDTGLFFSKDLYSEAQGESFNIKEKPNDPVRSNVVEFDQTKNAFRINNKRNTAISVAFWLKPQNVTIHSGTIIGEDSVFYFRYLSNRRIQFNHFLQKDINTLELVSENIWQHFAFTLNKEGKLNVYLNGEKVRQDSIANNWWKSKGDLVLGKDRYGVDLEGCLDDLMIWNRQLKDSEIAGVYAHTFLEPELDFGLLAYLPLNGSFEDKTGLTISEEENKNLQFVPSDEKGEVLRFDETSGNLTIKNISFDNQMSLSVWVKPEISNSVMGLLGNRDFSFRLLPRAKRLWFSIPMTFECKSKLLKLEQNEWVHLGLSVSYNHKVDFFVNGKLHDTQIIPGKTGNEGRLLIGESIWENQFVGSMCKVAVWDRALTENEMFAVYNDKLINVSKPVKAFKVRRLLPLFVVLMLVILVYFYEKQKKKGDNSGSPDLNPQGADLPKINAIYLLGNFEAWDKNGNDISSQFSPTLIRLFALIYLYPLVYKRQISSAELSDTLWESDSINQQKNSRSTNIHRLRQILELFGDIELKYSNKQWQLLFPENAFLDISFYNSEMENGNFTPEINNLQLCKTLRIDKLDKLCARFNELNIEQLQHICLGLDPKKDGVALQQIADRWLSIDSLSDEALAYLIKALFYNSRKQKALMVYSRFCSNYKNMLDESYRWSFEDCINGKSI